MWTTSISILLSAVSLFVCVSVYSIASTLPTFPTLASKPWFAFGNRFWRIFRFMNTNESSECVRARKELLKDFRTFWFERGLWERNVNNEFYDVVTASNERLGKPAKKKSSQNWNYFRDKNIQWQTINYNLILTYTQIQ